MGVSRDHRWDGRPEWAAILPTRGDCTTCMATLSSGAGIGIAGNCQEEQILICIWRRTQLRKANTAILPGFVAGDAGLTRVGRAGQRFDCGSNPSGGTIISDFAWWSSSSSEIIEGFASLRV